MKTAVKPSFYYRLAIWLASPIYRLAVHFRSHKLSHYHMEVAQRFGQAYPNHPNHPTKQVVWCHAVSLGELNTAYPLLKLFLKQGYHLWITSTTQTGYARAKVLFADELVNGQVQHSFVPIDRTDVIARFLVHVRPSLALFVETELWANTLYQLAKRQIPSMMVNARLTKKSYKGYANFPSLSASMMANLSKIIAQDENSAIHFMKLMKFDNDINKVVVSDSLKWVSSPVISLDKKNEMHAKKLQLNRPIWVAASTHAGEEELVLKAHRLINDINPNTLLILVPRHPERFDEVANLCKHMGFDTTRRSQDGKMDKVSVFLADSMGELMMWYLMSDVAFVGGSLVNKGGHTPIEPASVGVPIVMGQYTKNADVLVDELTQVHALQVVKDCKALTKAVKHWLDDPKEAMSAGRAGQQLVKQKSDAAIRQFELVAQGMNQQSF